MKKAIFVISTASVLVPALALAQNFGYTDRVISRGQDYLSLAVTILMIMMTIWFLWSVFRFIANKDAAKVKEKRQMMINGLIGLFIAVGVWGIIRIAGSVTGVDVNNNGEAPNLPCPAGTVRYTNGCH